MGHDELFEKFLDLKEIKRTGWVKKNVAHPESVADHSMGVVALAALIDLPPDVDRQKLIQMAIFHDIGESIIGDHIWQNGTITFEEKRIIKERQEKQAIEILLADYPRYKELVKEFMEQKTKEAKFLKELDKLDMVFQALRYEQQGTKDLQEFWDNVEPYLISESTRDTLNKLKEKRDIKN